MAVSVKPSDLKYRYPRDVARRDELKFEGLPDPEPFNRNDLYDVLPMMAAVLEELGSADGQLLHLLEDILNEMPRFICSRGEVFEYLLGSARECLRP